MSHIVADDGVSVPSLKLDTYLNRKSVCHVTLLKLDVEGYELFALRGAENSLKNRTTSAIYFEYFEKWLSRVHPPEELLEFLNDLSYQVCLCRMNDIRSQGPATHTLKKRFPGHGLPLLPNCGCNVPPMTDLLAVPKENLCRI